MSNKDIARQAAVREEHGGRQQDTVHAMIAVVVLNWRTPDLAEQCVRSVLGLGGEGGEVKCIVVDNASGDGSAGRLQSSLGGIAEIIETASNSGYAGGMNVGMRRAIELGAEYALLLNTDIEVKEGTLRAFRSAAEEHPDGAFFGPRLWDVHRTKERWSVGGYWDWGQGTVRTAYEYPGEIASKAPRQVEFVNGAAMFIRLPALKTTGMMDEQFGLYFEETDLCSRATRAGYTLWHVPEATVFHIGGKSMSKHKTLSRVHMAKYYKTRNRLLWGWKDLRGIRGIVFWLNAAGRFIPESLILLCKGRVPESRAVALGIIDFVRGRLGVINADK